MEVINKDFGASISTSQIVISLKGSRDDGSLYWYDQGKAYNTILTESTWSYFSEQQLYRFLDFAYWSKKIQRFYLTKILRFSKNIGDGATLASLHTLGRQNKLLTSLKLQTKKKQDLPFVAMTVVYQLQKVLFFWKLISNEIF